MLNSSVSTLGPGIILPLFFLPFVPMSIFRQSSRLSRSLPRFLRIPCFFASCLFDHLSSYILTTCPVYIILLFIIVPILSENQLNVFVLLDIPFSFTGCLSVKGFNLNYYCWCIAAHISSPLLYLMDLVVPYVRARSLRSECVNCQTLQSRTFWASFFRCGWSIRKPCRHHQLISRR